MAQVTITIELDDEYVDVSDSNGMTEEGHDALIDMISGKFGDIADGPTLVK